MIKQIKSEIESQKNPEKAKILQSFFKTGKGEYGEGDVFLGIPVPQQRKIAKKYTHAKLNHIQELLNSEIHEHRLIALLILLEKYPKQKQEIFDFYIKNTRKINNWDLVDLTAPKIIGNYLVDKPKEILHELSQSKNLWEKRISIISTFEFIKNNNFDETLTISKNLLKDKHDLMHKAVGWMLREVGKRNQAILEKFLKQNYSKIPRTTLRYAIEKFPEEKRKKYLKGEI